MSGSALDRYEQMPEWAPWRAANIHRFAEYGGNAELQALIAFASLVYSGKLKPVAPKPAPKLVVAASPPKKYVSWKALNGIGAQLAKLMAAQRDRIDALEKQISELKAAPALSATRVDPDDEAKIWKSINEIAERTKGLEARGLLYRGTWKPGTVYNRGDFCTYGGSVWHCWSTCTDIKPGGNPEFFTLAVKRGRDGRKGRHDDDAEYHEAGTDRDTRKVTS